ncbi:MAG: cupin domain-containing protein [Rudaea sp.]
MPVRNRPIEIQATRAKPLGMPPSRFLRDYWQKRPVLIRGAFPNVCAAISADDLAGLACEEGALARIVLRDAGSNRWTLRNGPFAETDFAKLPNTHWTLLVQDVDKWDMDVAALLDTFDFLPSWRVDDVMVSYATHGGGVGAHVDQYDVFLIQGRGQRRWRICNDTHAPKRFREDVELRLLREFNPTHEWLLEPGDALYLPPAIAHDGVAVGECMTFSVGMRAPSQAELLLDFAESQAERLDEGQRYVDPDLSPTRSGGEIDAAALERVRAAMPSFANVDNSILTHWFGCFITRYRVAHEAAPARQPIAPARLALRLPRSRVLRNPWSRVAWARYRRAALLFVAGQAYACPIAFARAVCASRQIEGSALARLCGSNSLLATLANLIDSGHLLLAGRRNESREK